MNGECLGTIRFETDLNQLTICAPLGELPSRLPETLRGRVRPGKPRFAILVRGFYQNGHRHPEQCWHPVSGAGVLRSLSETRSYSPEGRA